MLKLHLLSRVCNRWPAACTIAPLSLLCRGALIPHVLGVEHTLHLLRRLRHRGQVVRHSQASLLVIFDRGLEALCGKKGGGEGAGGHPLLVGPRFRKWHPEYIACT